MLLRPIARRLLYMHESAVQRLNFVRAESIQKMQIIDWPAYDQDITPKKETPKIIPSRKVNVNTLDEFEEHEIKGLGLKTKASVTTKLGTIIPRAMVYSFVFVLLAPMFFQCALVIFEVDRNLLEVIENYQYDPLWNRDLDYMP